MQEPERRPAAASPAQLRSVALPVPLSVQRGLTSAGDLERCGAGCRLRTRYFPVRRVF